jgi:hypothetical protein
MKKGKSEGSQAFNVPATDEGKEFVKLLRKFSNRPDCRISVRGRGKRAVNGQSARHYSSFIPLCYSEWYAVYIRSAKNDRYNSQRFNAEWAKIQAQMKRIAELEAQVNGNDPTKTNTLQDRNNQQMETIKALQNRNHLLETQIKGLQEQYDALRQQHESLRQHSFKAYRDLKLEKKQPVSFYPNPNNNPSPVNPPLGTVTISVKGAHIRIVQEQE